MTFTEAIDAALKGAKVRLPHWGLEAYVSFRAPNGYPAAPRELMVSSRVQVQSYIILREDAVSEQWEIV